jgi:hypothetical protein
MAAFLPRFAGAFLAGVLAGAFLGLAAGFFFVGGSSESGSSKSDSTTPASTSIIMESSDNSSAESALALPLPYTNSGMSGVQENREGQVLTLAFAALLSFAFSMYSFSCCSFALTS